jgi:transcriptional pleiotropic repressor
MSSTLLEKIRKVNKVLQTTDTQSVSFHDLSKILSEVLNANVYILSRKGRVLGYALGTAEECDFLKNDLLADKRFPDDFNKALLGYLDTRANLINKENVCIIDPREKCVMGTSYSTIVPVNGSGERLGTIMLGKYD